MERQARHNNALLEALEQLLDRLVLPEQTERVLASNNFTYAMCAAHPRSTIHLAPNTISCQCMTSPFRNVDQSSPPTC